MLKLLSFTDLEKIEGPAHANEDGKHEPRMKSAQKSKRANGKPARGVEPDAQQGRDQQCSDD
jgi:hypothetical protein